MKKEDLVPKYRFMDNFIRIYDAINNQEAKDLLDDMKNTILYQMEEIRKQRAEIIYVKHKYAWKHYDRDTSDYDISTRKYIDK
jgi:hypothetical protein